MLLRLVPILLLPLTSSLRVAPRRVVVGGGATAAAALVAPPAFASLLNTEEGELNFAERARIEGRTKAEERRKGFEEFTNKVARAPREAPSPGCAL